ncbi:hypothetical protein WP8S17C03_11430 [Metapseudomonas otitidis]|uniref:Uncharacterized protein n=1 Tax=Metapseudomonas otitidis TaxID=319939 RepID=A0A6S5RPL4_9GAMM|nr:hypothetical protein [Pseudomonas otitidis]BBT15094.1 hypothetical protein WP8S17C03_11430 [Pseudomonas otitidis]
MGPGIAEYFYKNFAEFEDLRFSDFLKRNSGFKSWWLFSDFCIGDKDKPNDTFAISICPAFEHPEVLVERIKGAIPQDLKKTRDIEEAATEFLKDGRMFHFVFVVEGRKYFFGETPDSRLNKSRLFCQQAFDLLVEFKAPKDVLKPFRQLLQESKAKSFNFNLLTNVVLFSSMMSFLNCMLINHAGAKLIGMFPDRDKIESWCSSIYSHLIDNYTQGVLELVEGRSFDYTLKRGVPSDQNVKNNWYDEFIRVPDYMAGVVASWDIDLGTIGEGKHELLFMRNIVDSENVTVLRVKFDDSMIMEEVRASRKVGV